MKDQEMGKGESVAAILEWNESDDDDLLSDEQQSQSPVKENLGLVKCNFFPNDVLIQRLNKAEKTGVEKDSVISGEKDMGEHKGSESIAGGSLGAESYFLDVCTMDFCNIFVHALCAMYKKRVKSNY